MLHKLPTTVFILLTRSILFIECGKPLMCYIAAYSVYRSEPAKFTPDLVDPFLCTHLIYAHLGIAADSAMVRFTDPHADTPSGLGLVDKVAAIKKKNPKLKILFSLGGWTEGSVRFSQIAESKKMRKELAKNIVKTLRDHNYDGIDMNWMHPNHRGGKPADIGNYILLLEEVRRELKKYGYMIVALMSGNEYIYKRAYDIRQMADQLDYILLYSFEYHGSWDGETGIFAPLRYTDSLSVSSSVTAYLKKGVQSEKILLGFSSTGRAFTADANFRNEKFFGVPAKESFKMAWTKETGFVGYNEICHEFQHNNLWTLYWHTLSATPFAVSGRRLITYEDDRSFEEKVNYLKEKNLGGAMIWSLDTDDFMGDCSYQKYPLTSILKRALQNETTSYVVDEPMETENVRMVSPIDREEVKTAPTTEIYEDTLQYNTVKIVSVHIINILYT